MRQHLRSPHHDEKEDHPKVSVEKLKEEGVVLVKDVLDEGQVHCCLQDHLKEPSSTEGDQEPRLEEHDADHPESAARVYKGKQEDVR